MGLMLLTSLTIGGIVQAAPTEEFMLDDVTVTATRITEKVKNVPANVTIITAEDLKKRNVFSVREALQNEVGIYMAPTAEVKDGLSVRGFGSKNILVLYNGQPVNTSFDGSVSWDSFPVSDVARIEIVRGASSSLYGGHAVAGVINIITKKSKLPVGESKTEVNLSSGSQNTEQKSIRVEGRMSEQFSFNAGYEKNSTDGYRGYYYTVDGKTTGTAATTLQVPQLSNGSYLIGGRGTKSKLSEKYYVDFDYDLTPDQVMSYSYLHNNYRYSYNDPFTYAYDRNGNPLFNGTFLTQNRQYITLKPYYYLGYNGEREQDIHKISYEDRMNSIKVGFGLSDVTKEGYSSASSAANSIAWSGAGTLAKYPSKNYTADIQKTWNYDRHTIVAGANWLKEKMTYSAYNLSNWRDWGTAGTLNSQNEGSTDSLSAFVQDEYVLSDRWNLYTGVRMDHYQKNGGYSYIAGSTKIDYPSKSFDESSPKVALEYAANDRTMYYVSYGHSFNPPTIYQLYRRAGDSMSSVQANPDLRPETSNTFEIGMKQSLDPNTSLDITLFHVRTQDKIALDTRNAVKAYYNMDSGMAKGIELSLKHKMDPNWSSYFNYTFESGENTASGQTTRNWDIPKHLIHAGVEYSKDKLVWVTDMQYVSARQKPDADTGEYGAEDGFFLVNTSWNYKIDKQWSMQLSIQNLLDRKFYASEAANGRTYGVSMKYSF